MQALRKPTAFLPIMMSLTALSLVIAHVAIFGAGREADEGTTAHLFQILMAAQLPLVAFFAIRWLPKEPAVALKVLSLQVCAIVAAFAPVFYFHL